MPGPEEGFSVLCSMPLPGMGTLHLPIKTTPSSTFNHHFYLPCLPHSSAGQQAWLVHALALKGEWLQPGQATTGLCPASGLPPSLPHPHSPSMDTAQFQRDALSSSPSLGQHQQEPAEVKKEARTA